MQDLKFFSRRPIQKQILVTKIVKKIICTLFNTALSATPQITLCRSLALTVRCSNLSTRFHQQNVR
jgi:hypothetical protein